MNSLTNNFPSNFNFLLANRISFLLFFKLTVVSFFFAKNREIGTVEFFRLFSKYDKFHFRLNFLVLVLEYSISTRVCIRDPSTRVVKKKLA